MSSNGALLQLLLQGDEDINIHSQDFLAVKPFRQVFKKVTPYAIATIEMDTAQLPSTITYGQTLRFLIPRKGDLLTSMTVRMRVKKTSQVGLYPAEELIESVTLMMGKQVIEELTGEYIRIYNSIMDTPDARDARYRMSDFEVADEQGTEKLLYCNIPLYFTHKGCCLPLIALQYTQPEIIIKFKSSVTSFDPTYQPKIQITGEYVFLDDTEREWWARQEHDMLFPYVQMVEDNIIIDKSRLERKLTQMGTQVGVPSTIKGPAADQPSIITDQGGIGGFTYITLVDPQTYPGNSMILYDTGLSAATFKMKAALLLPKDANNGGSISALWARRQGDIGYELEFILDPNNLLRINMYRNAQRIVTLSDTSAFTSAMTTVTGDSSSFDIRSDGFAPSIDITNSPNYEVWVDIDMSHSLLDFSKMTMTYTIKIFETNGSAYGFGRLTNNAAVSEKTKYVEVSEGYSAVNTLGTLSQMGFAATSDTFNAIVTEIDMSTTQVEILPIDENLTQKKTQIYTRGPVRYMAWVTTPADPEEQWATFSTAPERGSYVSRYDPLDSAQILINNKPRTDMEDASYYSVYHPMETVKKSLPSGVHMYSFCQNPLDFRPDASINFTRAGSITLFQRYKKWNETATTLAELRPSETFASAKSFTRIRIYMVGYNVLLHRDGQVALQCV